MKKFEGILARPIPDLSQHDLYDDERRARLLSDKAEREEALIQHFGYRPDEPDVWYKVALSLAEHVVPAYRPIRGRPKTANQHVEGWVCLWFTLRDTGTLTDTEAYQKISEAVGADTKTIRARVTEFRKHHPEATAKIKEHFRNEIAVMGPDTALRYALGEATRDSHALWVEAEEIRGLQGRPPAPEFQSHVERWDYSEGKK